MLNVLVKGGPRNGLILIRALEPKRGINLMRARRGLDDVKRLCSGPGKLTQALDINARHHEIDLCSDPRHHFLARESANISVVADPRIGISRSKEFHWRFTLARQSIRQSPENLEALTLLLSAAAACCGFEQRRAARTATRRVDRFDASIRTLRLMKGKSSASYSA